MQKCENILSKVNSKAKILLASSAMLLIAACAPTTADQQVDSLEPFNRAMFGFNEAVDGVVLRPVTSLYRGVVPEYGRDRVHNVLNNLHQPVVFVNSVLQGDVENAFSSLWSFLLNSTFGVAGIFDFAGTNSGLKVNDEDFGQTLGVWGFGSGPYLVLPILGPSSIRDGVGRGVDYFDDPFNYAHRDFVLGRMGASALDTRNKNFELLDEIHQNSLDPYSTIRSAYLQKREAAVKNTHSRDVKE